ncbi:MAG: hypothetical protein WAL50_22565 [Kineosporiaceae bacterium]
MSTAGDEREQRQLALMRERVSGLRGGALHLGTGIADLEALLSVTTQPPDWKDRFIYAWSVLEIAYAVALDRRQPIPTALTDPDIADALNDLDALIDEAAGPAS